MKQKLFIAAGIFHPEPGGPATYLYELLPALQARSWSPQVLTYGNADTTGYPYPVTRIPRRILPLRLLHYHLLSRRLCREADLIYAHTIDLPVAWRDKPRIIKVVGDQAWERSIRRGWIAPTTDIDLFQRTAYGWRVRREQSARSKQVQAFDAVIVPSMYLKRMVMGWGIPENKIHVIYNALPPLPVDLPPTQQAAREQLGWDNAPTLLTAARLTPWKGIDHLITALKAVPGIRLVVAGDGPELPRLQQIAAASGQQVQFPGRIPRDRLYMMMQAADYFALYSGYEGLPHTLLEALRVGTPVIASDKGGNTEVVRHDENGYLVPYVDPDALSAALQTAFRPDQRTILAENTRAGMERFQFETMVTATDETLRRYLR